MLVSCWQAQRNASSSMEVCSHICGAAASGQPGRSSADSAWLAQESVGHKSNSR